MVHKDLIKAVVNSVNNAVSNNFKGKKPVQEEFNSLMFDLELLRGVLKTFVKESDSEFYAEIGYDQYDGRYISVREEKKNDSK